MPSANQRRSARSKVLLIASIRLGGAVASVRVLDLSPHGAHVIGDALLRIDDVLAFRCGETEVEGRVAWVRPPHAGIEFGSPINTEAILPKPGSGASSITKDARQLDFRRPGFRGNQMSPEESEIVKAWKREQLEAQEVTREADREVRRPKA